MYSMGQRQRLVQDFAESVRQRFPQTNQYNILIFGSFLTERYVEDSDIDIGVFSLYPGLTYRLYAFTKDYFEKKGISNDVIRMRLSEYQFINLSIVLGQQYAVTDYCPGELIQYIKHMQENVDLFPKRFRRAGSV